VNGYAIRLSRSMLRKLARASAIGKKICMPTPIPIKGAIAVFAPLFLISLGPSVNTPMLLSQGDCLLNRTLGFRTCRTSTFYCVAKSATGATTISGLVSFGDVRTDGKVVRVSVVVDWLSMVQSWMYHESEPTPARREKARLNANEALRLQPGLRDISRSVIPTTTAIATTVAHSPSLRSRSVTSRTKPTPTSRSPQGQMG
jgi:hypothetical protein